ncbi:MAG: hypothetical protein RLZZ535_2546, partial [Cyanobacteriota bacterium]
GVAPCEDSSLPGLILKERETRNRMRSGSLSFLGEIDVDRLAIKFQPIC